MNYIIRPSLYISFKLLIYQNTSSSFADMWAKHNYMCIASQFMIKFNLKQNTIIIDKTTSSTYMYMYNYSVSKRIILSILQIIYLTEIHISFTRDQSNTFLKCQRNTKSVWYGITSFMSLHLIHPKKSLNLPMQLSLAFLWHSNRYVYM